ncbi:MAG TPA: hypothetical protein VF173_35685 [Thermoanaerobaculia bacterium]|nr:hypothetical protein [Thermoanaerobaculia bacterium]
MSRIPRMTLALVAALAAVLLAWACGGGGGSSPTEPRSGPKTVMITINDDSYDPRSVTINVGDTVQWVLKGSDHTHSVTAIDGSFDSGFVFTGTGMTFQRQFSTNNTTINYSCRTHKDCCNMKGSIRVGTDSPPPDRGYE